MRDELHHEVREQLLHHRLLSAEEEADLVARMRAGRAAAAAFAAADPHQSYPDLRRLITDGEQARSTLIKLRHDMLYTYLDTPCHVFVRRARGSSCIMSCFSL